MSRKFTKVDEQWLTWKGVSFSSLNHTYGDYSVVLPSHLSQKSDPKTTITTKTQITNSGIDVRKRNPYAATRNVN